MVKLTAKNDWQNATWYFHDMPACEKFKAEFLNHGARINWNNPIISDNFPEMSRSQREAMDEPCEKRVIRNLCWAFKSYIPDNPGCDISGQMAGEIMKSLRV